MSKLLIYIGFELFTNFPLGRTRMKGMKILKFKGDKYEIPRWMRNDVVNSVSAMSLENKETTLKIIEAYENIIENILLSGGEYRLGGIGCFKIKEDKEKKNKRFLNFHSGEVFYIDVPPCNHVLFKFSLNFKEKLKKKTSGNTFRMQWENQKLENEE